MEQSATVDRREQRRAATSARLTRVSRRLTAERGLGGFTLEELCDEVGVSRRTFFNYFPAKEDAVLGADTDDESRRLAEVFLSRGSRGWAVVLDDLADLVVEQFDRMEGSPEEHADFFAALEREPRLFQRFIGVTRDTERRVGEVVAEREGVPASDLRAQAVVQIFFSILRTAGERLHEHAETAEFASIMTETIAAARTVLGTAPRKAHS